MGSCSSSCVRQLATVVVHFYMFQDQTRDEGMDRRMDRWTAQHLWLSGLLSRRPHSLELSPGFYPGLHHQCRLFQTFAKNVFVCSILVHLARLRFSTITALYKSTYLLPVTFEFLINVMYRTMISWLYRRYINCPLIALAACSGKRSLTVWRPFFCLSVPSAYSPGVACNAASVHFGPTVRRADVRVILPFHFFSVFTLNVCETRQ